MSEKDKRLKDTVELIRDLGLPAAQQNHRSAMTLLALAGLKPRDSWDTAKRPLLGVTPIMAWIEKNYRHKYAPNTRETVRRQTLHQFVQAGIVILNPDEPSRPTNSPKSVYQLTVEILPIIHSYRSQKYKHELAAWLAKNKALLTRYKKMRRLSLVPLQTWNQQKFELSSGKHSSLIKGILEEFAPRYVPNGTMVYLGDTAKKQLFFNESLLTRLNICLHPHGKMPDVILYDEKRDWLFLIEAVTSHGPVGPKRQHELQQLFGSASAGLVYISAFPDARTFTKHLRDIAWETEVWISDSPDHLIHFDGKRFLGPY